ncbi:MMPL family transporter [Natronoglycomyces albus]|uniref:MMPL family transporter n=1 Tax=Natronoglycomyces albus TaxID=2811108 RepID=A0A895XYH8_9ACTN|nr:MMPL family transporter [Natronoglycomyces albus]QSB06668.1 MMPL family transporter [Natronoglycomyces albus]
MAYSRVRTVFAHHLTSPRGAWIALGMATLAFLVLFGVFAPAQGPTGHATAPSDSESARVDELLGQFPDSDEQPVLIVATKPGPEALTPSDIEALQGLVPVLEQHTGTPSTGPRISDDAAVAVIVTPIVVGEDNAETANTIEELRGTIAAHDPEGLDLQVTGGPAFGADVTSAFDNADATLLAVTILIVALLLIATYRSPILWVIPLVVIGIAEQLAGAVTGALGAAFDLQFDAGIISVLVFGAGTNYALLLISRYREELSVYDDHRQALRVAWHATAPTIIAANLTVVLALLTLALAVIPGTRGLGLSASVGLLIALAAVLFVLPPLLSLCGRGAFWPFIPKSGDEAQYGKMWRAMATAVMRRPAASLGSGLAVLAIMASGLFGTSIGLDQMEKFRVQSESAAGLEALSAHFPAGESQPMFIVTNSAATGDVLEVVADVDGVVRAMEVGQTDDGTLSKIMVTGEYSPGTAQSLDLVSHLRSVTHAVPDAEALLGGAEPTELDARAGNQRDLLLIAPLILGMICVFLLVLFRSVVAAALLTLINLASAVAAMGAGAWLSRIVFDQQALDPQVPLLAFLFLVALGIDYTIFLVQRARAETRPHGTPEAMVRAVSRTGAVITSAGVVLAAVFAALGVLPLVALGQLGVIVGVGIVVDALLVRTVIVPSLFGVLESRIWWPRNARS